MRSLLVLTVVVLLTTGRGEVPDHDWDEFTLLDEYVHRDDGEWTWNIVTMYDFNNVDVYIVNMTSQRWMAHDPEFCDKPLWYHLMGIAIPHELTKPDYGCLFIDAGSNSPDSYPGRNDISNILAASFANDSGAIVAYQLQVPNQPIKFRDDPEQKNRREDDVIAYTWRWMIDEHDAGNDPADEVAIRMPMTKAAKRGLDTIAAVGKFIADVDIDKFAVAGASKRGWTTWSLAATDKRVVMAIPLVMSLLNFQETLQAHFRAFEGAWSFAFKPYWRENLTLHFKDEFVEDVLFDYEDPFRYRSRLSLIPKLMVSATGDQFFLCQDYHNWYDQMGGPKWIMFCPNAEHSLFPNYLRIYSTVMGWFNTITTMGWEALPSVTWERQELDGGGKIVMEASEQPIEVRGMRAVTLDNDTRRDFRLASGDEDNIYVHPVIWSRRPVQNTSEENLARFEMTQDVVEDEWVGFMIEGTFLSEDDYEMYLTSEVHITPDTFPAEPCDTGEECYGYLV